MTAYDFSLVKNTAIAFDAGADTINMGAVDASGLTATTSGSNLTLTNAAGDFITFTGVSLAELSTTNVLFGTGSAVGSSAAIYVGDNSDSALVDNIANTIDDTDKAAAEDANNLIYGMGGADNITASNGDNIIFGGTGIADSTDGADTIVTGTGTNTIYGNAGNDNITAGATEASKVVTVYAGLGDDQVTLGAGVATSTAMIFGNSGTDSVDASASAGDMTIYGGNGAGDSTDGADEIQAGTGSASIFGNAGNDTITTGASAANEVVSIYAGLGNDEVTLGAGVATATASVFGNTGSDTIDASAFDGDATIYGGNGISDSTDGDDTITIGNGTVIVYANAGDDTINVTGSATSDATIYTGLGSDVVSISGGHTDSTTVVTLATGAQTVDFDAAAGRLVTINNFDGAADTINFDLSAGDATDLVLANGFLFNDVNSDGIYQTAGEESINLAGLNKDLTGDNLVLTSGGIGGAVVGILATSLYAAAAGTLTGGDGNDQLIAGNLGDTLDSGIGNDHLLGGTGADVILLDGDALTTNDTIAAGSGTDTIEFTAVTTAGLGDADFTNVTGVESLVYDDFDFGGVGTDTLNTQADEAGITTIDASALTGTNTVDIVLGGNFNNDITFTGGAGGDTLDGSGSDDAKINASGGAGDDVLKGAGAADTLAGGGDDDTIDGGAGVDVITGGAGNDSITGGIGAEALSGGTGTDTFHFAAGDSGDTATTNAALVASLDHITDWSTADDTLEFATSGGTDNFIAQSTTQAAIDALHSGSGAATLLEAVNEAVNEAANATGDAAATAFQFGGATYALVIYDDGDATYLAGTDVLVKLDGAFTLTLGDFSFV